jgi:hypothetical protein
MFELFAQLRHTILELLYSRHLFHPLLHHLLEKSQQDELDLTLGALFLLKKKFHASSRRSP